MVKIILNIIRLPIIYLRVFFAVLKQQKFLKKQISPLLNEAKSSNDGSFTSKDLYKINQYYGLNVPAILGEAFCKLRGKPMSDRERWASTSQGVITGLFDDFFDDFKLPKDLIVKMIEEPKSIRPQSSNEKLFLDFYLTTLRKAKRPELIKKHLLLVKKAQIESMEQENQGISNTRIKEITHRKGGNSIVFYRVAFDHFITKGEEEALFQLGSVMQLENDIFDIYKDLKKGISTLPTRLSKVADLRAYYTEEMNKMIDLSYKMNYPKNRIKRFLDQVIFIINIGFTCLDQLEELENSEGTFNSPSLSRKQLICDMEKLPNMIKSICYQIKNYY